MMNNILVTVFSGLFMLMAGALMGNAMHGKTINQTAMDVAVIKAQIRYAHPNKFSEIIASDTATKSVLALKHP